MNSDREERINEMKDRVNERSIKTHAVKCDCGLETGNCSYELAEQIRDVHEESCPENNEPKVVQARRGTNR